MEQNDIRANLSELAEYTNNVSLYAEELSNRNTEAIEKLETRINGLEIRFHALKVLLIILTIVFLATGVTICLAKLSTSTQQPASQKRS